MPSAAGEDDSVNNDDNNIAMNDRLADEDVQELDSLYHNVVDESVPVTDISNSISLLKLERLLQKVMKKMDTSRTAKLWLLYKDYIETVKLFIHAERLGSWSLHLIAVEKMLNLFAATGHIHYAKSARLYLQQMRDLPNDYPWLYKSFTEHGYHTIRRSDRRWAGLWTDLVIEQVMMRSIKSLGGLTRGRGITEGVRHMWIHSMHRCASIHNAMTTLTNLHFNSSEQHVELGTARRNRDYNDLTLIANWLDQHNPFDFDNLKLRSLSTGITAEDGDGINCDLAEESGEAIHMKLDNLSIADATIKRCDQIKPIECLYNNVKINGQPITPIDPSVLCSRLVAIALREDNVSQYFEYELAVEPTATFKQGLMRPADKPKMREAFIGKTKQSTPVGIDVLDGGDILHTVRWSQNTSYDDILKKYVVYIRKHYGTCYVVFDGYDEPSTKDHEHIRRSAGCKTSANITIIITHTAHNNQEAFLNNSNNKSQFISLLCEYLMRDNQHVHRSTGDADTLVISVSLQLARDGFQNTVHGIRDCLDNISPELKAFLLFMDAFTGCDTNSSIFNKGKQSIVKLMAKSLELQQCACVFNDDNADQKQVGDAGVRAFIIFYGANPANTSLNNLRY